MESLAEIALRFSQSIDIDGRLFREDVAGSIAHVTMLAKRGIISTKEARAIARGLKEIRQEIERGQVEFDPAAEDIHMAIEGRLIAKLGPTGGRLHTARSRNDQIALDERLWLRGTIDRLSERIRALQRALVDQAERHAATLMPGYTHLQRAQPVLLGHHLLAYVSMLDRDRERLQDCRRRANRSPLGSAALAGTSFPIDRAEVARELGFDGIVENSIDGVGDRDFLIEFVSSVAIATIHLSRLSEELVIWSTTEFNFVELSDSYTTGSSIMPQKKNPDMAELVRGKSGRVYGDLMALLTIMKGLPLAYNRDMQEDKEPAFDAADTLDGSLAIMEGMIAGARFNAERMATAAAGGFSTATEIADYLVRNGLPFRKAHEVAGRIVTHCVERQCELFDLDLSTLRTFSPLFQSDIAPYLHPETSVVKRTSAGSASYREVKLQIRRWRKRLGTEGRHTPDRSR